MAITKQNVLEQVNADESRLADCERCLQVTEALLERYLEDVDPDDPVPEIIYDQAHLAAAVELFNQGEAPNGVLNQQYEDDVSGLRVGTPIRIGSDPLRPAYPLLERWVIPAIGGIA